MRFNTGAQVNFIILYSYFSYFCNNRNLFVTLVYSNSHLKDVKDYKKKFQRILF